jgi:hypothetical protein
MSRSDSDPVLPGCAASLHGGSDAEWKDLLMPPRSGAAIAEDVLERLARLEEQLRSLAAAVERLGDRDTHLDQGMRILVDRVQSMVTGQAEDFRESLERLSGKFASREDMAMVKALVLAAIGTLSAFAFRRITGGS